MGNLALVEITPAFGECKKAKLTALVSGDAAKAAEVAAQHGVPAKNIYNYQTYDQLRNNPDVDVIYMRHGHKSFSRSEAFSNSYQYCGQT